MLGSRMKHIVSWTCWIILTDKTLSLAQIHTKNPSYQNPKSPSYLHIQSNTNTNTNTNTKEKGNEQEQKQKQNEYKLCYNNDNHSTSHLIQMTNSKPKRIFPKISMHQLKSLIQTTFLPSNKDSKQSIIPSNYLRYVGFNAMQDISTQVRSIIATQRVFEGVGVGIEGATAASASLQFLMRDGVGMASSLLFTARHGSQFGKHVKQWRFFADMIVDLGIFLEVVTYYLPKSWFLPFLCLANMCKALCGVAAGSSGGAISVYWAEKANTDISDIHAKFGAQVNNTLISFYFLDLLFIPFISFIHCHIIVSFCHRILLQEA